MKTTIIVDKKNIEKKEKTSVKNAKNNQTKVANVKKNDDKK